MKTLFVLCRPVAVLVSVAALAGCESTKTTPSAQSNAQNQPAAPVGNPVAAYNVVSKELQRDPENERLQQAQQRYGTRTVDQLLAERDFVPDTNLSVHERILVEAQGYASERSGEVTEALAALRAVRQEILAAFNNATTSELSTSEALTKCAPFAKYAHTDVDIREALLASPFVAGLETAMRDRANSGQIEDIRALQQAISDAGYEDLLRGQVDAALHEGTRNYLNQQLDQRFMVTAALPGERAVWATLLGESAPQLKLGLLITGADDPEIPVEIAQDISDRLGAGFAIEAIDRATLPIEPDADVFLVVDIDQTDVQTSERVEDRPSEYIKSYENAPNPEYEEAFQEWTFARNELDTMQDQYELALVIYEEDKEALSRPSIAEMSLSASALEGEEEADENEQQTAAQQEMGRKFYIPPPQPPDTRRHGLATRQLQNTPRKVRRPVFEEYQYSARIVDARFEAVADLEVFDRLSSTAEAEEDVTFIHERSWTQTTGVHVRDSNHAMGDLTEESLNFEQEVFLDGFSSTCIDKTRDLLRAKALELLATAAAQQKSSALTFGLAMFTAAQDTTRFELSTAEMIEFAEMLRGADAGSSAWRVAGLTHIIRRGMLESTVPLDTATRLVESSPAPATPPAPSPGERLRRHADS